MKMQFNELSLNVKKNNFVKVYTFSISFGTLKSHQSMVQNPKLSSPKKTFFKVDLIP